MRLSIVFLCALITSAAGAAGAQEHPAKVTLIRIGPSTGQDVLNPGQSASLVWTDSYSGSSGFFSPNPGSGPTYPTQKAYGLNVVPGVNAVSSTPPYDCRFQISNEEREVTANPANGNIIKYVYVIHYRVTNVGTQPCTYDVLLSIVQ